MYQLKYSQSAGTDSQRHSWFSMGSPDNCWEDFTQLFNEIVELDEISQSYNYRRNPDRKGWDLEFHEPHQQWKAVCRKGGVSLFSMLAL